MKKNNTNRILNFGFILLLSLLLTYTVFREDFMVEESDAVIKIVNTAKRDAKSWGTDVRIRSVKIDQQEIPFENLVFDKKEWIYLDGLLVSVNPQKPVVIEYRADKVGDIEIELQKHEGSGVVAVTVNNRLIGEMNLYSPNWAEATFMGKFGTVKILSNPCGFMMIFLFTWIAFILWKGMILKKRYYTLKYCLIGGSLLIIAHIALWGFSNSGKFLCLELLLIPMIEAGNSNDCKKRRVYLIKNIFLLFLSAVMQFYMIECINENIGNVAVKYAIANISIYFAIFWLLYLIVRRLQIAVGFGMLLISGYGVVNYYVTKFRGSPIVPGDFFVMETAKSVMLNYHYTVTDAMFFSLLLWIIWCITLWTLERETSKISKGEVLSGANAGILLVICILTFDFYKPDLDFWNLNNNVRSYGIAMSLVSNVRRMKMQAPDGYSYEKLEVLCEDYMIESNEEVLKPNVIAIMNESFSDLSVLDANLNSDVYMPYFNSMNNSIKGTMMVSTLGGGTGNTEYEFLTGNTIGFTPGAVPYQQYVLRDAYSLTGVLKDFGYYAVAIHPYDKQGYNRYRVYPYFGFDEFLDIEDFHVSEKSRDLYVTDEDSYKKVIQTYERIRKDEGKPAFIFNVTMQNHGGYETGYFGEHVISVPGREKKYKDVEEYLSLIKESDDALPILIEYFAEIEEPTVIAFFGDHQPKLDNSYYEEVMGKPLSEWNLDEEQKRFEVPFFIWANYDISGADNIRTSANYLAGMVAKVAGIKMTPYLNFLCDMKEDIPAININGYQTKDGIWHYFSDKTEAEAFLDNYKDIQYNNVFAKRKCKKWFTVNWNTAEDSDQPGIQLGVEAGG